MYRYWIEEGKHFRLQHHTHFLNLPARASSELYAVLSSLVDKAVCLIIHHPAKVSVSDVQNGDIGYILVIRDVI